MSSRKQPTKMTLEEDGRESRSWRSSESWSKEKDQPEPSERRQLRRGRWLATMIVRGDEEDKEKEESRSELESESEREETLAEGRRRRGVEWVVRHTSGESPEASSRRLE